MRQSHYVDQADCSNSPVLNTCTEIIFTCRVAYTSSDSKGQCSPLTYMVRARVWSRVKGPLGQLLHFVFSESVACSPGDLELAILLPQFPQCWDDRRVPGLQDPSSLFTCRSLGLGLRRALTPDPDLRVGAYTPGSPHRPGLPPPGSRGLVPPNPPYPGWCWLPTG